MKRSLDLEDLLVKIHSAKTRELVIEVFECYKVGAHRPALVMLWTVVITDLLLKIEEIAEIYEDKKAKHILESIKLKWKTNPASSQWELELIKDVKSNFSFISEILGRQIEHLKDLRNICAHPTFNHGLELYQPSAEQCKGIIRTFTEELFILPPLQHESIVENLLNDLNDKKDIFINEDKLGIYLEAKYYSKSSNLVLEKLFKALWKIVFKLEDEDCKANREHNFTALNFLTKRKGIAFESLVSKDKAYYNKISENKSVLTFTAYYLSIYPVFFGSISEDNKILLRDAVKDDYEYLARMKFLFASENDWLKEYSRALYSGMNGLIDLNEYFEKVFSTDQQKKFIKIAIKQYGKSSSFVSADSNFNKLSPLFKYFDLEDVTLLVDKINSNNQTSYRNRAKRDHQIFVQSIREKFEDKADADLKRLPDFDSITASLIIKEDEP